MLASNDFCYWIYRFDQTFIVKGPYFYTYFFFLQISFQQLKMMGQGRYFELTRRKFVLIQRALSGSTQTSCLYFPQNALYFNSSFSIAASFSHKITLKCMISTELHLKQARKRACHIWR